MKAYIDYLRLASWSDGVAALHLGDFRQIAHDWKPGRWLQYHGQYSADSNAYYGIGEQNGRRHYVMRLAGASSSKLGEMARDWEDCYCTRFDVQVTVERPSVWHTMVEYTNLDSGKRQKSLIDSATGATIYIGNRTSETFCRLYEKLVDNQAFLRLEFELKGKKADAAYRAWRGDPAIVDTIWSTLFTDFGLPERIEKHFAPSRPDAMPELLRVTRSVEKERIAEWLGGLGTSIARYGNDPDIGDMVRAFVRDWARMLDKS